MKKMLACQAIGEYFTNLSPDLNNANG
jgi:hypothetical protein